MLAPLLQPAEFNGFAQSTAWFLISIEIFGPWLNNEKWQVKPKVLALFFVKKRGVQQNNIWYSAWLKMI